MRRDEIDRMLRSDDAATRAKAALTLALRAAVGGALAGVVLMAVIIGIAALTGGLR